MFITAIQVASLLLKENMAIWPFKIKEVYRFNKENKYFGYLSKIVTIFNYEMLDS